MVILESLKEPNVLDDRVTIIEESNIAAPPDDPYPVWSQRLVRVAAESMWVLVMDISRNMTEDFYNHFVDDATLIVVFSGRYFVLDKFDKTAWQPMVEYGKTVRVGPEWTMSIPVDYNKLYEVAAILTAPYGIKRGVCLAGNATTVD